MSTSMDDENRRFSVKDVENYHQKQRLKALHEAREQFFEVRRRVTELELEGRIDDYTADKAIRDAVEELILQCEQLMNRDDISEAVERNYWESCWLGEMPLPPGARTPDKFNPKFNGLQSIIAAPDPIPLLFETDRVELGEPARTDTRVEYTQIPRKPVLENAYRRVEEFLEQVNLGIQLEQGRPFRDIGEGFDGFE